MKETSPPDRNGQAAEQLKELLKEFGNTLPKQFTLGTIEDGSGRHRRYPDLHFTADEQIPGLYYADLDPEGLTLNGNGHANGMEFKEAEPKEEKK